MTTSPTESGVVLTYKDLVTQAMTYLGMNPKTRFIGYGVGHGSKGGGTFKGVPDAQLIETPLAENLMAGLAIGWSLRGYCPVVHFERFDFVLNALDAIVNHLDKMRSISCGEFAPAAILRIVVGNSSMPLYTGPTHVQDFSEALSKMVSFPVVRVHSDMALDFEIIYRKAMNDVLKHGQSTAIVEYKDEYSKRL